MWYFDATGTIHKNIANEKKPFYYSIVIHDVKKKAFFPFSEFVTTAQDQITISKYLGLIKNKINKEMYPDIVVVDQSWALINSILLTFNNCNVTEYLKFCFQRLFLKDSFNVSKEFAVKIYLCSTHQLHNVINKTKKIKVEYNIRNLFIFMFTLIQNSVTIIEVENYLINIYNVFNNPNFDTTVSYSLNLLQSVIKNRKLSIEIISTERTPDEIDRDKEFESFIKESDSTTNEESIAKNSPFKKYFDQLIEKYKNNISKITKPFYSENEYYNPQLFNILQKKLYILPLWSGLMIDPNNIAYSTKTRLTNNPVENWFGQLKNNMKLIRKSTSIIVALTYRRLASDYMNHYAPNFNFESVIFEKNYCEKWKDKKKKKKKDKKFSYFQNQVCEKLNFNLFGFDSVQFENAFNLKSHDSNSFGDSSAKSFEEDKDKLFDKTNEKKSNNAYPDIIEKNVKNCQIESENNFFESYNGFILEEFEIYIKSTFEILIEKNFDNILLLREVFISQSRNFNLLINHIRKHKDLCEYRGQKIYSNYKKSLSLEKNLFPIISKGDGNCLYNSISQIIYFTETNFFLIKACALFTILTNEQLFSQIIKEKFYEYSFNEFFCQMCRRSEWATELIIFSISIFLKRNVLCYSKSVKKSMTSRVKYSFFTNRDEPIRIGFMNNHFFPILRNGTLIEKETKEIEYLETEIY